MFKSFRASLDLRRRLGGVEETLAALDTRLDRSVRKGQEDIDMLALEVQRLRGRVTGKIRNPEPDLTAHDQLDWQDIDEQIRKGTYQE